MTTTQYKYGDSVIEFPQHAFNADELQECIQRAEDIYYGSVKTPAETDKLAASIYFNCDLLAVAIPKLIELVQAGYTLRTDRHIGMNGIALTCTLTIPQKQIEKDLIKVHAAAAESYEHQRWIKNSEETLRQLKITADRKQRDREKALAAAEQKRLAEETEQALQELREAYATA